MHSGSRSLGGARWAVGLAKNARMAAEAATSCSDRSDCRRCRVAGQLGFSQVLVSMVTGMVQMELDRLVSV